MAITPTAVLAWNNLVDVAATISGGGAVATLPVQNLQDPQPRKLYRTIGTTAYAIIDNGSPMPFDIIVATGTNLSTSGTARVRASNTDPTCTSSLVYDSNSDGGLVTIAPDPRYLGNVFLLPSSLQTARYIRLDLTDATLANIDWGRWFVSAKFVPQANMTYGYGAAWGSTGLQQQSIYGQMHVKKGAQSRIAQPTFDFLSDAERATMILEMQRIAGPTSDVVFIENPLSATPSAMAFIGLLDPNPTFPTNQFFSIWQVALKIAERL